MADHTPHQKRIIKGYYDRRDDIMLARLGEIVTELILAETGRRRDALWTRAEKAMNTLKISQQRIRHIVDGRDAKVLAANLRGWLSKTDPPRSPAANPP